MANLKEYQDRMKASVGDKEQLTAIQNEIESDADLSGLDRKRLNVALSTQIKMLNGQAITEHDTLAGMKVVATSKVLDNADTIGMLVMFSVSESGEMCAIPNETLLEYWGTTNLTSVDMPKPHREKDAFKKACADFKGVQPVNAVIKKLFPSASKVIWDIDQLNAHEYQITRKIVSLVDADKKKDAVEYNTLSHDKICKIVLDETKTLIQTTDGKTKEQSELRYRVLSEKKAYDSMVDEIMTTFVGRLEFYKNNTTGKKVRDAIRDFVRRNNGINFTASSGGTWFIPISADSQVAEFKAFIKWVDEHHTKGFGVARFMTIPLVNDIDIKKQINDDVHKELEMRMNDLLERTLAELSGADESQIDGILEKKLKEHSKNRSMLVEYRKILADDINVQVEFNKLDNVTIANGTGLSGRQKALLQQMASLNE